ncbi:MAG: hypothetical protein HYZ75_10605 [Elusimicrobia bacterium]|nr:hypothetical protein [Elusimicrobiota bacterium]
MRVVLLGLTGFGNEILPALLADPAVEVPAIFTRSFPTPFPFYDIPQLHELCRAVGVRCHDDLTVSEGPGLETLRSYRPDLILVAAFHQILREPALSLPGLGVVNLHPSLLPEYKGADPLQAALLDGAAETGITYHRMTAEVDTGDILLQAPYRMEPRETIASLRLALARLGARHLPALLEDYKAGKVPAGRPQAGAGSSARKRYRSPVPIETGDPLDKIDRLVRSVVPSPGATVEVRGTPRAVRGCEYVAAADPEGTGFLDLSRGGATLRLFL